MSEHPLNKDVLVRVFFFGVSALLIYQLFLLAAPFMTPLVGAAALAMTFYPLHERLLRRITHPFWAALISTLGVLLLAVIPLLGMGWFLIRETAQLAPAAKNFLEELRDSDWPALAHHLPHILQRMAHGLSGVLSNMNIDLKQVLLDNFQTVGGQATFWASQMVRNVVVTVLNALILTVSLFFAFRDGARLLRWGFSLIPMQAKHKHIVAGRVYSTFRAVVVGSLLTASAQGATALIGYLIAGVRLPILLGMATSLASMLGSSFLVTLPVSLTVLHESTGRGVFLLIWSIVVVGVIDNFLRPILIGSRAKMPFVLIFFSIVGGVKLYGIMGVILGPMLVAGFLSFVQIYEEEYEVKS